MKKKVRKKSRIRGYKHDGVNALRPDELCARSVQQEEQTGSKSTADGENTCSIMRTSAPAGPGGLT